MNTIDSYLRHTGECETCRALDIIDNLWS